MLMWWNRIVRKLLVSLSGVSNREGEIGRQRGAEDAIPFPSRAFSRRLFDEFSSQG
jgi:hypothetical protein